MARGRTAAVVRAISTIEDMAWTVIHYRNAIWDDEEQRLISDAQVAEVPFASRKKPEHVSARLIVCRFGRPNPTSVPPGQGELFAGGRHHAVFTDSPLVMFEAEANHRDRAVIEQVIIDLKDGARAHLRYKSLPRNTPGSFWPRSRSTSPAPPG